jgi:glutamine cyclotransferase
MKKTFPFFILISLISCKNKDNNGQDNGEKPKGPDSISFSIVRTYPHDTSSFTQGLTFYKGELYEGTGNPVGDKGHSSLMKVDLKTGTITRKIDLESKYFGEGITILNDTVYQLTWQNKVVFVYTLKDFKKIKEFPIATEGWGITTDGRQLIVSDGSSRLYYYEPKNFTLIKKQDITEGGSLAFNLNELEFIDGYVYANQWQAAYILKIDPNTGQIVAKANLTPVWDRVLANDKKADVPNGIAYDTATRKMYVTGKLWPELYEIQFSQ